MKRFITFLFFFIILGVAVYFVMKKLGAFGQNGPGTILDAYYAENGKTKVLIINDEISTTYGGGRGSNIRTLSSCWLIQLDATTGKVLKRKRSCFIDYIGADGGNLWLVSSDTLLKFHSMNPITMEVVESYKSLLAKAEEHNPDFKGKVAEWEADTYSGNILITSFDARHYYVNPTTFETHEFTDDRQDKKKINGLSSVGIMEQDRMYYLAYTDSTIYQLDGNEAMQLSQIDKYRFGPTDAPGPNCEPAYVTSKHVVTQQRFIDAAFVYDAYTRQPLRFDGDHGTFIYHLDRVGKGGHNMLSHVDPKGNVITQYDITQTDPKDLLKEAFIADGKLFLIFPSSVQARDASGKLLWQYTEDSESNQNSD